MTQLTALDYLKDIAWCCVCNKVVDMFNVTINHEYQTIDFSARCHGDVDVFRLGQEEYREIFFNRNVIMNVKTFTKRKLINYGNVPIH